MPPAYHQVSVTSLKLLIQQIHPHVRIERDSGMCVARDLYELRGRGPYTKEKELKLILGINARCLFGRLAQAMIKKRVFMLGKI